MFFGILSLLGILLSGPLSAEVEYDAKIPQVAFAAQELGAALKEAGQENLQVALVVRPDESSPEAFQIRSLGPSEVWIIGADATGSMYGGLEVANLLRLGLSIGNHERAPFIRKRGIKFNIPWDVRTPSYDDSGDAAQNNIESMAYLDRYHADKKRGAAKLAVFRKVEGKERKTVWMSHLCHQYC